MKTWMIIVLLAIGSAAGAQNLVGIRGGFNTTTFANNNSGGADKYTSMQSFNIGLSSNMHFLLFSFHPSLLVTGKGSEVTVGDVNSNNYFTAKSNPTYLELPATFNFNLRFGKKTGVFAELGPYIAAGIGGRNKVSGVHDGVSFAHNDKIDFSGKSMKENVAEGGAYSQYKRFDYGTTFNAGVYLFGVTVEGFYDLGLTQINTLSNPNHNDNLRNRTYGVSIGYMFGN